MNFKPVILLAFANDKIDNTAYLRNLSAEVHGIRKALAEAVNSGLCEVVERTSASVSDIIDVFSDPIFGPRVSIFHYGGHADGFSLLLEKEDGTKQLTHKDGLIPFLARQENLKLIFLNGCCSEGQTTDLLKAGIPAVIGTTTFINDEIATSLSIRFYSSLTSGASIEQAWTTATDEVKITSGTTNTRALYWEGKKETIERFPWVIQFKTGAEIIKEWNLPDISGNPLYGLPSIPPSYNLPESPFLYLNRYERKHAEVFFGRSFFVRSLFSSITDSQGPPIILLSGQSGTGKSSLLEAGIQSRLESKYEIIYLRRNGAIGLSGTLYNALLEKSGFTPDIRVIKEIKSYNEIDTLKQFVSNLSDSIKQELQPILDKLNSSRDSMHESTQDQNARPGSISSAWKLIETKLKRPLLVILDQLEEAYTRSNVSLGNEMNQLFLDLKSMFGNPTTLPQGKILLSYRKEYQAEIEEHCKKYELPRSKVFIEHISKTDIIELFNGFTESPRLKTRYNLSVEVGLPESIAEDLAADKDSPIAPMLQVLLTKMWKKASTMNSAAPAFTHDIYQEIKEEGLAMDEFLSNQIQSIKKKLPEYVDSGFVLDMLAFHCTVNNTSAARSEKELHERYPFAKTEANKVLAACKDSFLITDLGGADRTAMLAHDTLAKSVVKAQQRSTLPIQQGKRILGSRLEAIKAGSAFATMDSWELKLIEKIQTFLPAFNEEEKKLFDTSRSEIIKQERLRKAIVNSGRIITALSILTGIVAWYLFSKSIKHEKDSFVTMAALTSNMNIAMDPSMAIRQALDGLRIDSSNMELKKVLLNAYYYSKDNKIAWYKNLVDTSINFTGMKYHRVTKSSILLSQNGKLTIIDSIGKTISTIYSAISYDSLASHTSSFDQVQWDRDGQKIITLNQSGYIELWDQRGSPIKISNSTIYSSFDYSDSTNLIVALAKDYQQGIDLFDLNGKIADSLRGNFNKRENEFTQLVKFHPSGKYLLLGNTILNKPIPASYYVKLIDLKGNVIISKFFQNRNSSGLGSINISASGSTLAAILVSAWRNDILDSWNHNLLVWNKDGKLLNDLNESEEHGILDVIFHPKKESYLVVEKDQNIFATYTMNSKTDVFNDANKMNEIKYSPSGQYVFTAGSDNISKIWETNGTLHQKLIGHTLPVTGIDVDQQEQKSITVSSDGTVKSWVFQSTNSNLEAKKIKELYLDPTQKFLFVHNHGSGSRFYDLRSKLYHKWPSLDSVYLNKWFFIDSNLIIGINREHGEIHNPLIKTAIQLPISNIFKVGLFSNSILTASPSEINVWTRDGKSIKTIRADTSDADFKLNTFDEIEIGNGDKNLIAAKICKGSGDASDSCYIRVFNQDGIIINTINKTLSRNSQILFSTDNKYLIIYSDLIFIFDLANNNMVEIKPLDCDIQNNSKCRLKNVHQSINSNLITASTDGMIKIWDLKGLLLSSFQSNSLSLKDANFTPDGSMVYSYDIDSTLDLWSLQGNHIHKYNGHDAFFSKDGNEFYTIKSFKTMLANTNFAVGYGSALVQYLTPQGASNYFKANPTFSYKKDNSLRAQWKRILEWLRLG